MREVFTWVQNGCGHALLLVRHVCACFHDKNIIIIIYVILWQQDLGGNSQNFLRKFLIFFLTLGLKILRL